MNMPKSKGSSSSNGVSNSTPEDTAHDQTKIESGTTTKEASTSSDSTEPLLMKHKNTREQQEIEGAVSSALTAMHLHNTSGTTAAKDLQDARSHNYQFWQTQPVPMIDEQVSENCAIEPDRPVAEIRDEPFSLPGAFTWEHLNIDNEKELVELYTLLNENYVEDDDHMFRFDYSPEFLRWALKPPGWLPQWHLGVRATTSNKLLAFISAVPCTIRVFDKVKPMVEVNFLCVHKKLRAKRVAPVLIREITRRVNLQGIFQAVYTAGIVIPKPIGTCRYWHRPLNPKKLIEVGFSYLSRNMTMQRTLKLYKLHSEPQIAGFRALTVADIPQTYRLLTEYMKSFHLAPMFSLDEFTHYFTPQTDVVNSFVVENKGIVTDFVSFYSLPSTVVSHARYKDIRAAYSFYNVAGSVPWEELMHDALAVAAQIGYDVFNALDLMDNAKYLKKLKFGIGDGNLQYYLFNWRCPEVTADKIA